MRTAGAVKSVAAVAVVTLVLGLGTREARAQGVVDGFAGNGIVDVKNFFVTDSGSPNTDLFAPLAGAGTYTIHLGPNAQVNFGSGFETVTAVDGFFEVFTSATPNHGVIPPTDPRTGTTTNWSADSITNTQTEAWGWHASNFGAGLASGGTLGTFSYSTGTNPDPNQFVFFGFDIKLAAGELLPNGSNTGEAYFEAPGGSFPPSGGPTPEPAFYQLAGLLGLGGVGLLRLRRPRAKMLAAV